MGNNIKRFGFISFMIRRKEHISTKKQCYCYKVQ